MKKIILVILVAVVGIVAAVVVSYNFQITKVTDDSMQPTFAQGDTVLINRASYRNRIPRREDIVVFHNNIYQVTGEAALMGKRVIGISGDQIGIKDGKVILNGKNLEEEYLLIRESSGDMGQVIVKKGYVFVLGDNRGNSSDSRSTVVGQIKIDDIIGKVIFKW